MDIRVSGHQLDIGEAFRNHVTGGVEALVAKYGARSTGAAVTLAPGPHDAGFVCDIVLQLTQGLILKGSARSNDTAQLAFDAAADKIDRQLRRYKRRLVDRRNGSSDVRFDAGYTILQPADDGAAEGEAEPVAEAPLVVAETRVDIPEASVSDAVMMLDLRNTTALLFKNSGTGSYNMVYRRDDGNIGWVEPQRG